MQNQSSPVYEFDLDFEIDEHGHQILHDHEPGEEHQVHDVDTRLEQQHSIGTSDPWNESASNAISSNLQRQFRTDNHPDDINYEDDFYDDGEAHSEGRQLQHPGGRHRHQLDDDVHQQQQPWTSAPSSVGAASSNRSFLQDVDLEDDAEAALLDDYLQEAQKSQAAYSRMLPPPENDSAAAPEPSNITSFNELSRALPSPQQQQQQQQQRRDSADYEVSQVTALMDFETGDLSEYGVVVEDPAAALAEAAARAEALAMAEEDGELIDVNVHHDPPEADYDPIELHDQVNSALESAPLYSATKVYSQYPQQQQQTQQQQQRKKPVMAKDRRSRKSSTATTTTAATTTSNSKAPPPSAQPQRQQPSRPQSSSSSQQQQQQQSRTARIPRSSSSTASGDGVSTVAASAAAAAAGTSGSQDDLQIKQRLRREETLRQQQESVLQQLQSDYDRLLTKHALAEVTIDQLRLGARVNVQHQHQFGGGGDGSSVGRASRWSVGAGFYGNASYNTPSPQQHQQQRLWRQQQRQRSMNQHQQQQQQQQRARSAMTDAQHQQLQQQGHSQAAASRQTSSLPASPSVVANKLARRGVGGGGGGRGFDPRLLGGGALIGGKKGQLLRKIQALHKRLDSANLASLPVEEQEQLRTELRQAFDQLQKEFANRIVGGGADGEDGDEEDEDEFGGVDVEQLEGELFQLSMRLDELDEQVTENARQSGQKRRTPFRDPTFDRRRSSVAAVQQFSATAATETDAVDSGPAVGDQENRLAQLEELYLDLMSQYRQLRRSNGGGGSSSGAGAPIDSPSSSTGTTTAASGYSTSRRELDRLVGELRRIVAESAGRSRLIGTVAQLEAEIAALGSRRMPAAPPAPPPPPVDNSPAKSSSVSMLVGGLNAGAISENDSGFATSAAGGGVGKPSRRYSSTSQLVNSQQQQQQRRPGGGSPLDELMSGTSSALNSRRLSRNTDTDAGGSAFQQQQQPQQPNQQKVQQHKDAVEHDYQDLEQDIRWLRDQLDTEIEAEAAAAAAAAAGATPDDAASLLSSENNNRRSSNSSRRQQQLPPQQQQQQQKPQQSRDTRKTESSNRRPRQQTPFTVEYDREGRPVRRYPLEDDYYYNDDDNEEEFNDDVADYYHHGNENRRRRRVEQDPNRIVGIGDRIPSNHGNNNNNRPLPAGILRRNRRRRDYYSDVDTDDDEEAGVFDDDEAIDDDLLDNEDDSADDWPEFEYSEYSFYPKRHPRDASPRAAGMRFRGGGDIRQKNRTSSNVDDGEGRTRRPWRKVPERRNRGRPISFENRVCSGCGAEPGLPHRRSGCLAAAAAAAAPSPAFPSGRPPAYPHHQQPATARYPYSTSRRAGPLRAVHGLRTHAPSFAPPRERYYNVDQPKPLRRYIVTETGPQSGDDIPSSLRRVASVSSLAAAGVGGRLRRGYQIDEAPPIQQEFYIYEADGRGVRSDYGRTQSQLDLSDAVKAAKMLHKLSSRLHRHLKRDIIYRSSGSSINLMGVY